MSNPICPEFDHQAEIVAQVHDADELMHADLHGVIEDLEGLFGPTRDATDAEKLCAQQATTFIRAALAADNAKCEALEAARQVLEGELMLIPCVVNGTIVLRQFDEEAPTDGN